MLRAPCAVRDIVWTRRRCAPAAVDWVIHRSRPQTQFRRCLGFQLLAAASRTAGDWFCAVAPTQLAMAGGVPWRLPRNARDLTVCYIGVAFYHNSEGDTLDTSVAQVFNERGDGVIVRGGPARVSRVDRQPYLTAADARNLPETALDTYHREHRTQPARVVLHKASALTTTRSMASRKGRTAMRR
jgi:hypothetical protein